MGKNLPTLQVYQVLLAMAVFVLIFGYFRKAQAWVINVHDTYFVIGYLDLAILMSIILALGSTIFWFRKKKRN